MIRTSSRWKKKMTVSAKVVGMNKDWTRPGLRNAEETGYGMATHLEPEIWKTLLSISYFIAVTMITSLVMVVVHDRVPDMKKYPPLPDIFLDNVPLIPWAFEMCEVTGCILSFSWILVLVFHKHRFVCEDWCWKPTRTDPISLQ